MPTLIIKSVGSAAGRDYPTLAAFAAALPANLITADQDWIAELDAEAYAPVSFSAICDATRRITVRAAAGQGFDSRYFDTEALTVDAVTGPFKAPLIAATTGPALSISGSQTLVVLQNIQLASSSGPAIALASAPAPVVTQCLLSGNSSEAVASLGSGSGNTGVVQWGTGPGLLFSGALSHVTALRAGSSASLEPAFRATATGSSLHAALTSGFRRPADHSISFTGGRNAIDSDENFLNNPDRPDLWTVNNATATLSATTAPDGSATVATLTDASTTFGTVLVPARRNVTAGTWVMSVYVRLNTAATYSPAIRLLLGSNTANFGLQLSTGAMKLIGTQSLTTHSHGVDLSLSGWARVWVRFDSSTTQSARLQILPAVYSNYDTAASNSSLTGSVEIWAPSITAGTAAPTTAFVPNSAWLPGADLRFLPPAQVLPGAANADLRPGSALQQVVAPALPTDLRGRLRASSTAIGAFDPQATLPEFTASPLAAAVSLATTHISPVYQLGTAQLAASTALTAPAVLLMAQAEPQSAAHLQMLTTPPVLASALLTRAPASRTFVIPRN